ncbi:hypothetical protein A9R05_21315 [Burkholderia sp. KK1]|nr:hypothetical protein A9R05_21315 [Burkholderia sp. KK1]
MWTEAKAGIAPFQRIDDVLRMVESLAELRARYVERVGSPCSSTTLRLSPSAWLLSFPLMVAT